MSALGEGLSAGQQVGMAFVHAQKVEALLSLAAGKGAIVLEREPFEQLLASCEARLNGSHIDIEDAQEDRAALEEVVTKLREVLA